jgi:hypothetical protein
VEFKDEQGIDGGGLTKTFLTEVSAALIYTGNSCGDKFASRVLVSHNHLF